MANVNGSARVAENLSDAAELQGMPREGSESLESYQGATGGPEYAEPAALGMDATAWVALAMAVFIAILLWKRVPALVTRSLDQRIATIRTQLDEARTLRAEAEALRAEYAAKIAGAETDAQAIVTHAEAEARDLIAKAKADTTELMARRAKMAEDKIAAAERAAVAEVRATAANAAAAAAAQIIARKHDAGADKPLVDSTIAGLGRLN